MKPHELKALRKKAGLSVDKSARLVHVATRTWARYEDGSRPIPKGIVHLFCLVNDMEYIDEP